MNDAPVLDRSPSPLARSLPLPCGAVLPNRLAKSAMTEGLSDASARANPRHARLYRRWSEGGAGLLITGNVMVDWRYLERPGNVVVEDDSGIDSLARWAEAGTVGGNHLWVQLSHAGRQSSRMSTARPVAPSAVQLKLSGFFARPRALTEGEILDIVERFAVAAEVVQRAGFSGVQIHSAHGYLSSQFLSPRVNQRDDRWGGSLEHRARFLLATVRAVRARVGPEFPIAVKLNSADFQRGGFELEDAARVAGWLAREGIDLLEISGGTYERLRFFENNPPEEAESTRAREAYFLTYAQTIRAELGQVPLMVTGGFRSRRAMNDAPGRGRARDGRHRPAAVRRPRAASRPARRHRRAGAVLGAPAPLGTGTSRAVERREDRSRAQPPGRRRLVLSPDPGPGRRRAAAHRAPRPAPPSATTCATSCAWRWRGDAGSEPSRRLRPRLRLERKRSAGLTYNGTGKVLRGLFETEPIIEPRPVEPPRVDQERTE